MDDDSSSFGSRQWSRRRFLALAAAGAASATAGCGSGDGGTDTPGTGDGTTPTGTPAASGATPTTTPVPTTRARTDAATRTPTASPTSTGRPTETPTPTDAATPTSTATPRDVPDGGSYYGPGDGFADPAPWLDDDTPVYTVSEPTREALVKAVNRRGERVVVFETSGTIDLGEYDITISSDRCYLAGQTAPSPGITLVRGEFSVDADDCVVQHLRVRPGDAGNKSDWQPDSINTGNGSRNNVIDHCTATWSVDEVLSVGYRTTDTTVSNCLIAHALHDASHRKGPHGYGSLTGDGATGVAYLGNVWAHNSARNPRLKADTESVVVNNVMYHFEEATNLDNSTLSSIVGNAYRRVDEGDANIQSGKAFVDDNLSVPETDMTENTELYAGRAVWPSGLQAMSSSEVTEHNLTYAGARPADRTELDQGIVSDVRNDSGSYIDSQSEVGGYPDLPENTRTLDVPDSGLRAWLERHAVAVEEPGVSPP